MKNLPESLSGFNPALFWDAGELHPEENDEYIIRRVLEYGDEKDIKTLRSLYDDEKIISVVTERRGLSSRTRNFWCRYFNLPESKSSERIYTEQ
ncbi:MAG: hypothetical protein AB9903_07140 [Vulcanimicrobiota bacterium]